MSPRPLLLPLIALAVLAVPAQAAGPLVGKVEGDTYISATGAFQIKIPVLAELGGTIEDTPNEVTFRDDFTTYISIAVFPMDTSQRWELSIKGTRDYLVYFFETYVLPNFQRAFKTVEFEKDGIFIPKLMNGSFITYALLPGGSMFPFAAAGIDPGRTPPVAKRGNLLFVRNDYIFVVSVELGERATEGAAYTLKPGEEDSLLREELTDVVKRITFLTPAASSANLSSPLDQSIPPADVTH